ncbi:tetratricopeptide repeat protein [Persicimonas caeni]|nr:tetratricopeptide repeat protein [Persicimonas caeni]
MDDFEAQARGLEKQVRQLEERYLKPELLRSRYKIETRFNDAKVAYLLEDYGRASILFVGLVDNPRAQSFESYDEALYLLADSLLEQRNFLAARKYFQRVVERGQGPFFQNAVINLLEIAAATGNYEGVAELNAMLDNQSELSPAVNYVRAKTLYRQGKFADARRYFQKASQVSKFALRADYFRGVAFAAEKQFDNAEQVFNKVIADHKPKTPEEQELIDLTNLALGRIAYEKQDYDTAIGYYQRLKRTSPHFDQMLYELTWTFIAQENYQAASRVTDIFLYLENPDPTFVPKVKLLKADLLLRLQRYDLARSAYTEVVDTFSPVKQELEAFVANQSDLQTFFNDLVEAQIRGEQPDYLPTLVQQWIDNSDVLDEAKLTVSDLASVRQSIESSYSAIEQMEARLESGAHVESFPKLAEGMTLAVELESRMVGLRQDMIEAQYKLVSSSMSQAEKQQWKELEERVAKLRERYEAMPKTRAQVLQRAERIQGRFSRLRKALDQVSFDIESQQEQLEAIESYVARNNFTAEQLRKIDEKKAKARKTLAALRKLQGELRQEIDVARQRVGMGDKVTTKEQAIRNEYRDMLVQQRQFLDNVQGRSGGSNGVSVENLQAARTILPRVESKLQTYFTRMNELVGERTQDLRQDLASERKMLGMLDKEVAHLMGESKAVTAAVAYRGFIGVKRDFRDIIMRGDIGLIDVAWQKKEDMTQRINQLFEDRTAELKTLQESFEEVR